MFKRSCNNCKALQVEFGTAKPYRCKIGYIVDEINGIPLEVCPKPNTYAKYIELNTIKEKYKLNKIELANWKFV